MNKIIKDCERVFAFTSSLKIYITIVPNLQRMCFVGVCMCTESLVVVWTLWNQGAVEVTKGAALFKTMFKQESLSRGTSIVCISLKDD